MDIQELVRAQRTYFDTGATRPYAFRLAQLKKLQQALRDNEQMLEQAMMQDFRKAPMEVYMCETGMVLEELRFHLKHLKGWMRERAVPTPLAQFPAKSFVSPEPYGVALIISPWNYPVQLCLSPLVGAISGGNCAVVKPSAYAPATSAAIAKLIRENEGKAKYIGGGEESFGYLAGDYVRDKDAVSACSLAAEAAAWAMDTMGLTLYEWLQELYVKYGFYREGLVSVVRKGKEGAELIQKMMVEFRANPPKTILGSPVVKINDFLTLETTDVKSGAMTPIVQDRSNVLQWFTEDGTTVSVRPSGTEPKIKFYFGVKAPLASVADFDEVQAELDAKIEGIKKDLKLE